MVTIGMPGFQVGYQDHPTHLETAIIFRTPDHAAVQQASSVSAIGHDSAEPWGVAVRIAWRLHLARPPSLRPSPWPDTRANANRI